MSLYLAILCTVLVILHQTFANEICDTIYSNKIGLQCLPCGPGFTATDDCTENLTRARCDECMDGTFQPDCAIYDNNKTSSCKHCTLCSVYKESCTIYHDAVCEPSSEVQNGSEKNDDKGSSLVWMITGISVVGLYLCLLSGLAAEKIARKIRGNASKDDPALSERRTHVQRNHNYDHTYDRRAEDQLSSFRVDKISKYHIEPISEKDSKCQSKEDEILEENTAEVKSSTSYKTDANLGEQSRALEAILYTDQTIGRELKFDTEIKRNVIKNDGRQYAVVHPNSEQKNNDCKEVVHVPERLQQSTRESLQSSGDSEISHERSENNNEDDKSCDETGNRSLSLQKLDKGTSELQINWPKVFSELAGSLPPMKWEIFAINLLSNCHEMNRSVQDTVNEIKDEARIQHTEGWVNHAYIKVFFKWLSNLGSMDATFDQIEEAVCVITDAKETLQLVRSIKSNPPRKAMTPMIKSQPLFANNYSNSQHCVMALHNGEEVPGTSSNTREIYIRSSQRLSYPHAHCLYCSSYSSNEITTRQENLTSVQYNRNLVKANDSFGEECIEQQNKTKKRKVAQSTTKQYKRVATEIYIIENAKQNLLLDIMPIRQNDYNLYMDFVINLIESTCGVVRRIILAITHNGFCEVQVIKANENETIYILRGETNIFLTQDVYEELAVYGNNARPKLLSYLKAKNGDYDNTASEKFLFLTFKGGPVLEETENPDDSNVTNVATKKNGSDHLSSIRGQMTNLRESGNNSDCSTSLKQKFSDQSLEMEPTIRDIRDSNASSEDDLRSNESLGATSKIIEPEKENPFSNTQCENGMINEREKAKQGNTDTYDVDIEKELEDISASFFPTGDETYSIVNTDNLSDMLERFVADDLQNSAKH